MDERVVNAVVVFLLVAVGTLFAGVIMGQFRTDLVAAFFVGGFLSVLTGMVFTYGS